MKFAVFALLSAANAAHLRQILAQEETTTYPKDCDCDCEAPTLECPDIPDCYCSEPDCDLADIIDDINGGNNENVYGTWVPNGDDNEGTIVSGYANQVCQEGTTIDSVPDVYNRCDGVESFYGTSEKADKGSVQGCKSKKFTIEGCVVINEERCGGFLEKVDSCEAGSGQNCAESLHRVGDVEADLPTCDDINAL